MRILAGLISSFLAAGSLAIPVAHADTPQATTLYVNQVSSCSNSGPGTEAIPYCTIQAAANVVDPGQTVVIEPGSYGPVTITRSGTTSAPITFTWAAPGQMPSIYSYTAGAAAVLTLSHAHDITISFLHVDYPPSQDGIDVIGSQRITLDRMDVSQGGSSISASAGVSIDGASSSITVSRTQISMDHGYGLQSQSGAQQVTATSDAVFLLRGTGISLSGTSADVTSNSVRGLCGTGIDISGGSSAVVENNHLGVTPPFTTCPAPGVDLSVAADSVGNVRTDYDALVAGSPSTEYSWGGTLYADAASFQSATGQGAHDIDAPTWPNALGFAPPEGSPLVDSADCNAPGELATDVYGKPRVDDPEVTDTGTGTCHADRGAVERQDILGLGYTIAPDPPKAVAPLDIAVTITSGTTSGWGEPISYSVDFGDGGPPVPVASGATATHTYTTPGLYTLAITAADTGGSSQTLQRQVVAGTTTAPNVTLTAGLWVSSLGIAPDTANFTISAGADDWELQSGTIAFGDGSSSAIGTSLGWVHTYARPGTYTATLTETDLLGRTSTAASTNATVGDEYQPYGPYSDYTSRDLGIDKVPAHAVIKLSMKTLNAAFSNVRGAYVNVTVRNPKETGHVTVYPDGTSIPKQATVQFRTGHAASNKALAMPGSDQVVDFYNGSSGPIDLIVDTFGLDVNWLGSGGTYTTDGPVRVLSKTPVAAGGKVTFAVAGTHGVPAGASAVALAVTATSTMASGYLTAYADGTANPGIRDANWAAGQRVTGLAVVPLKDGKVVLHNSSSGSADFTADLAGYHVYQGSTGSVFLPSRRRLLDTLTGTGTGGVIAKIGPKHSVKLQISGKNGIPASGISAVAVNLTASGASAGGFIEGYPDGMTRPAAVSLSYGYRAAIATAAIIPVGSDGAIDLYNGGSSGVDLIVDLTGSYYQYPSLP